MELVFNLVRDWASWIDFMALFVLAIVALRSFNWIKAILLVDFVAMFCLHEATVATGWFQANIMIWIYCVGVKDAAMAVVFRTIKANSVIITSYALVSIYSIMVWITYYNFYSVFLNLYAYWGLFVTLMMLAQLTGIFINGGNRKNRVCNSRTMGAGNAAYSVPGIVSFNPNANHGIARAFSRSEDNQGSRR